MPVSWRVPVLLFVLLMAIVAAVVFIRRIRRIRQVLQRQLTERDASLRCRRCGYTLEHLYVPRCPECGALKGFDRSSEEMGIDPSELRLEPARRDITPAESPDSQPAS
jgi:uncharacterized paraquat-inducible protein A